MSCHHHPYIARIPLALTLVLAALIAGPVDAQEVWFTGTGALAADFAYHSEAHGVSPDGSVVVGNSWADDLADRTIHWTPAGGLVPLDGIAGGAPVSYGRAASANGDYLVGWGVGPAGQEAYRWSAATGQMTGLGKLEGGVFSEATGVSATGEAVVGWTALSASGQQGEAFRWTPDGGMVGLGAIGGAAKGSLSTAWDVSADGSIVVGGSDSAQGPQAFRWTGDRGMTGLGFLPDHISSQALGISADGNVIVGESVNGEGKRAAFLWTEADGLQPLGDLPGGCISSSAMAASADGSVIVGEASICGGAFVWDAQRGMRSLQDLLTDTFGLDLTGWQLLAATDVSDDGKTIVGYGISPNSPMPWQHEAWVAHIPEPASLSLLIVGAAAVLRRRRLA